MFNQKRANKFLNKLVKVTWKDIFSEIRQNRETVDKAKIIDLLALCTSFGVIYKIDDYGIVLVSEFSGNEIDYTVIPYGNILNIEIKGG